MEKTQYSPGILQYIPFFYVIWSDDLLSYSETAVVKKAVEQDDTLTQNDRSRLLQWLDKNASPANEEFKNWKQLISNSKVKLIESETYPLSTFSQKMVCRYHAECPFNNNSTQSL